MSVYCRLLTAYIALSSALSQTHTHTQTVSEVQDCKCTPGDDCWPREADFHALNDTVAGRLVKGVPPGSVCYIDQPNYNETECAIVRDNWLHSTFHALDPISIGWPQWAGNPCPPIFPNGTSVNGDAGAGAKGCHIGGYPAYALKATEPTHIQQIVRFARDYKIRLNVKSTGHSFTGRSTAYGSISIWTHYLQGVEYQQNFVPQNCNVSGIPRAFRIGAGSTVRNVYEAADKEGAIVVGGSAQDVGIVGWFTGGGHGPLSSTYGMGVDNVLQATVVMPTGELVIANECQHEDLFWAVRGGGGGTFGIVTEVVMKGHDSPSMQSVYFNISATDSGDLSDFWDAAVYFWSQLPRLKEAGLSGYAYLTPPTASPDGVWAMLGAFSAFDKKNGTAIDLFDPIEKHIGQYLKTVQYQAMPSYWPSFFSSWNSTVGFEPVGGAGGVLGSRLLPSHALTSDPSHLRSTLQNLTETPAPLQFFMVANSDNRDLNVSLNPAWRDAVLHVIATTGFLDNATLEMQKQTYDSMTYDIAPQLKSLATDSGAYFNEADPNDPNWQYTFFGTNYPRLKAVKQRYDPDGVLWCRSCVGSEDWVPQNKYDTVIGEGKLCRATWSQERSDSSV